MASPLSASTSGASGYGALHRRVAQQSTPTKAAEPAGGNAGPRSTSTKPTATTRRPSDPAVVAPPPVRWQSPSANTGAYHDALKYLKRSGEAQGAGPQRNGPSARIAGHPAAAAGVAAFHRSSTTDHRRTSVASTGGGGRDPGAGRPITVDAAATQLQSKLQSLMSVREQIEQLASKHRHEEVELSNAVQQLLRKDTTAQLKSQQELEVLVKERDKAIEMLTVFRREGRDVINRLHDSLKASTQQCEEHVRTVAMLTQENDTLREKQASFDRATVTDDSAANMQRRCSEYAKLLQEADRVVVDLRDDNERLREALATAQSTTSTPQAADEADRARSEGGGSSDSAAQALLRDQLRSERRQRLEAEEQWHLVVMEQQRRIQILENRLTAANAAAVSSSGDRMSGRRSATPRVPTAAAAPRTAQAGEDLAPKSPSSSTTAANKVASQEAEAGAASPVSPSSTEPPAPTGDEDAAKRTEAVPGERPAPAARAVPTEEGPARSHAAVMDEILEIDRQLLEVQRALASPR